LLDDRAARVAEADHTRIVVLVRWNAEPRPAARPLRDGLGEVALVPGRRAGEELLAVLVDDSRLAAPELREAHVVGLVDLRRRCRHRPPVELVHVSGRLRTVSDRETEAVALAPRVRADEQAALTGEAERKAAGRQNERRLGVVRQWRGEPDVARGGGQGVGDASLV